MRQHVYSGNLPELAAVPQAPKVPESHANRAVERHYILLWSGLDLAD
jgi:hypothetical protein